MYLLGKTTNSISHTCKIHLSQWVVKVTQMDGDLLNLGGQMEFDQILLLGYNIGHFSIN